MIIDSLKSFERYLKYHPGFDKVGAFLKKNDLNALAPGKYDIDENNSWCTIWEGEANGLESLPKLEVHDSFVDIYILLEGDETIGYKDRAKCVGDTQAKYDEAEDVAYLEDEPEVFVSLSAGNMLFCFPKDAHAPLIGEGRIRKAVIKVRV
ncbi:MAG: YhcH/YjgK/YiaL family protein [Bacteroidales bacterium]|nr:YhcH/YjgK/YiaL family protein [Bacteroidales bacterium]